MPEACVAAATIDCAHISAAAAGPGGHDLQAAGEDEAFEAVCVACNANALVSAQGAESPHGVAHCSHVLYKHIQDTCELKAAELAAIADDYESLVISSGSGPSHSGTDTGSSKDGPISLPPTLLAESCQGENILCSNHGLSRPYTSQKGSSGAVVACFCECIDGWTGEDCGVSEETLLSAYNGAGAVIVLLLFGSAYWSCRRRGNGGLVGGQANVVAATRMMGRMGNASRFQQVGEPPATALTVFWRVFLRACFVYVLLLPGL